MADYDPSNKYYYGTKYFLGKISSGRKFGFSTPGFKAGPHAYSRRLFTPEEFADGDVINWGELRDVASHRGQGAKWFHDHLPREYASRIVTKFGPAAGVSALSMSSMLTRPHLPREKSYHIRDQFRTDRPHYDWRSLTDPADYETTYKRYPTFNPVDLRSTPVRSRYSADQYTLEPSEPADVPYSPPLYDTYHGSHDLRSVKFQSRFPQSRSVVLTTAWTTGGVYDSVYYRTHTIDVGRLSNPFGSFTGLVVAGVEPAWSVGADLYNMIYSKHHVDGFELFVDVLPNMAGVETSTVVGYYDRGFAQGPCPLTAVADLGDWMSQPTAQYKSFNKGAESYRALNDQFTLHWSCDTHKEFDPSVADDNRTDETYTGAMVVPSDPKYYRIYLGYACTQYTYPYVPRFNFKLIQHVTFYSPRSLVDA